MALMADGHFAELEVLHLSRNPLLGDEGAWAIAGALSEGLLPKLQELDFDGTGMGDADAAALADRRLQKLTPLGRRQRMSSRRRARSGE